MPKLSESAIRELATPQSFARGQDYHRSGAVLHIECRGTRLLGEVRGSQYRPYQVTVELDDAGGVVDYGCTCAYDWDGACKHVIAVLLAYNDQSDQIEQRPTIDALLAGLDRDTLHDLARALLERQPELVGWLESWLALRQRPKELSQTSHAPHQQITAVGIDAVRRQIRKAKRAFDHEDYYRAENSSLMHTLNELRKVAFQFIEGGDPHSALDILTVLVEEIAGDWYYYDEEGESVILCLEEVGDLVAEALLSGELTRHEREEWAERVTEWLGILDESGLEIESFDVAIGAALQGWDDDALQPAMRDEPGEQDSQARETPRYAGVLTNIRLRVLERQGRTDEYLNLARAEGQAPQYVTMLVKLGRVREAVDYGLLHLRTAVDALVVAQMLRNMMCFEEAFRIAEQGLALYGDKVALARWVRDFAATQDKLDVALRAAQIVFAESLMLADYQAVQSLAGDGWLAIRHELLAQLQAQDDEDERIDIYLHEKMIDEAIKTVDTLPYAAYRTIEKVVAAALATHPDWAIHHCRQQAEAIIDAGKSNAYYRALHWLAMARQAHQAAGRELEWQRYLQSLLAKHRRKYALVPGLRQLLTVNPP